MARLWQEGFEHGAALHLKYFGYDEYGSDESLPFGSGGGGTSSFYVSGRNEFSKKALCFVGSSKLLLNKKLPDTNEIYTRVYAKYSAIDDDTSPNMVSLLNNETELIGLGGLSHIDNISKTFNFKVRIGGTLQTIGTVTLNALEYYRIEFYLKVDSASGAYELRINDETIYSASSVNTGTLDVNQFRLVKDPNDTTSCYYDDIAINDVSGSVNNSWPGEGTIIGLRPNSAGTYSQWDNAEGRWIADVNTTSTNVHIPGHGLNTGDWMVNYDRGLAKIVTVVDADNFTVSTLSNQAPGDAIILYKKSVTFINDTYTFRSLSTSNYKIDLWDLIVSNGSTYGVVMYIAGKTHYVELNDTEVANTISTIGVGATVDIYKQHRKSITDRYNCVNSDLQVEGYARLRTSTSGDMETYGYEGLVSDIGLPSGVKVNGIRKVTAARDLGEGGQINHILRTNSVDYISNNITLNAGKHLIYDKTYSVSPNTGVLFTQAEVDSIEAGVKAV